VEATAGTTETQLAKGLRHACPSLTADLSLPLMLARLRRDRDSGSGPRLLIVLDQFEQWLHAHGHDMETSALVAGLRHADGSHVQFLLLVRDDFWMGTSRLFELLEINLDRERNARAVDLFDAQHARRVLTMIGQAYDRLPTRMRDLSTDQSTFLDRAVAQLSQDGRVIPVRLSLFADLMKDRPWTTASLVEVGGAEGVGLRFLEETFAARTALPDVRALEKPVRALLQALLPEHGSDIKGRLRSRSELAAACGLAEASPRFLRLLAILDRELHILTPTEMEHGGGPVAEGSYFQLTHDYLVPSLRQWLTQEQRKTWRGRAQLRLAECSTEWSRTHNRRMLPSLLECTLLWAAAGPRPERTPEQRAMLRAAAGHHAVNFGIAFAVLLCIGFGLAQYIVSVQNASELREAETAVAHLLGAGPDQVPDALRSLQRVSATALPLVRRHFEDQPAESSQKLHAAYALAQFGEHPTEYLVDSIPRVTPRESRNLVAALRHSMEARSRLLERTQQGKSGEERVRCAMVLLALGDSRGAEQVTAPVPDPTDRTRLIHTYKDWCGDLDMLDDILCNTEVAGLRSALCTAVGFVAPDSVGAHQTNRIIAALTQVYQHAADAGSHSAAGWALRQWNARLPALETSSIPPPRRNWFVNRQHMTMLRIPHGTFVMGDAESDRGQQRSIRLTHDFFICDREISLDLFQRFVDDHSYPAWKGPASAFLREPKGTCPVNNVSWYDAVAFCNWLSKAEHRAPCYVVRTGPDGGDGKPVWTCDFNADGYRLPTTAEWEYVCRAGTSTAYPFGDRPELLPSYAHYYVNSGNKAWPGGSKLPNAWGVFDMLGNVSEWCWDWSGEFAADDLVDPTGPANGAQKLSRGGNFLSSESSFGRSGQRASRAAPSSRSPQIGLRVVTGAGDRQAQ
jgi:formylglycine-generating enzyme required for sulfatase activity